MADEINVEKEVTLEYKSNGRIALITFNAPKKLNALTQDHYFRCATLLHEIAKKDEVVVTVLTGTGRFFSAGADIRASPDLPSGDDVRPFWANRLIANNLHNTHAFYTHPKILVTALNGPVVGLSAALIAFSDFIYAAPHAYLLTPFTSLGLISEGNAAIQFVRKMGLAKANEALLMSKRISAEELLATGFVNRIFDTGKDDKKFLEEVLKEVEDRLGDHLNKTSLFKIKQQIRSVDLGALDRAGAQEVVDGLERFVAGVPQEEFMKVATGQKRHKL